MIKTKQFKAFTLIELLVSVAILLLILGAAVSVEVNSIKSANRNEHSLQAANLAQEQLNLVKTVRDNNVKVDPNDPFKNFPILNQIKYLNGPKLGTWGLSTVRQVHPIYGDKYTVEIRAWDACDLGAPDCGL